MLVLEYHYKDAYLTKEEIEKIFDYAIRYLNQVHDSRGFDESLGWIHAFAHGADLLASCIKSDYFLKKYGMQVLGIVDHAIVETEGIMFGEEGRMARAVMRLIKYEKIDEEFFLQWFKETSESSFELKTNEQFKNFCLTLIYTLKNENIQNENILNIIEQYLSTYYQKYRCF